MVETFVVMEDEGAALGGEVEHVPPGGFSFDGVDVGGDGRGGGGGIGRIVFFKGGKSLRGHIEGSFVGTTVKVGTGSRFDEELYRSHSSRSCSHGPVEGCFVGVILTVWVVRCGAVGCLELINDCEKR